MADTTFTKVVPWRNIMVVHVQAMPREWQNYTEVVARIFSHEGHTGVPQFQGGAQQSNCLFAGTYH